MAKEVRMTFRVEPELRAAFSDAALLYVFVHNQNPGFFRGISRFSSAAGCPERAHVAFLG